MDLQSSKEFEGRGIELVSISPDPPEAWRQAASEFEFSTPVASDTGNRVAGRYGVMRWRVPPSADVDSAEPGHTFVLVDADARVVWIRDYGAPQNGGLMYVPPEELVEELPALA